MTQIVTRRWVLGAAAFGATGLGVFALGGREMYWRLASGPPAARHLTVQEAHRQALSGDIILVDIRSPEEWAASGSGEGAVRLDMRRDDFAAALTRLTEGDLDAPVALICARGVRSARLTARLSDAGFTQIIDVPEGMFGSSAGPGWVRSGLPVERQG